MRIDILREGNINWQVSSNDKETHIRDGTGK